MLEQWEKEKAETEGEHEKKLLDMKHQVATMQAQQEEERTRVENAKHEVKTVEGEFAWFLARLELWETAGYRAVWSMPYMSSALNLVR